MSSGSSLSPDDEHEDQTGELETLTEAALRVLNTADPFEKARLGDDMASRWLQGAITQPYHSSLDFVVPDRPARFSNVKTIFPSLMPKLGKAGSLQSRQTIVHSVFHTESWAIDLSWDIIARFGKQEAMPREFFTDFVKVAQDEGRHSLSSWHALKNWVRSMDHSQHTTVFRTQLSLLPRIF